MAEDRDRLEKELMQKVLEFESKVNADGQKLQGLVKTELSILGEELGQEETKRREFDQNLLFEVNSFLNELK